MYKQPLVNTGQETAMTATPTAPAPRDVRAPLDSEIAGYWAAHRFASPPEAVFAALTSAEAITQWWVACSGSGTAGGRLHFSFGDAPMVADVTAAEPGRHVRWSVASCAPAPDWDGTNIDFLLRPADDGGTLLEFCHEGLTEALECFDICRAGWRQYLPSLVEYVDRDGGTAFGSEHDERAEHQRTRS